MVFEKKQLSKVLAVFMIVACALAFMPLLNGQAFAAAKPAKVTVKSAKQVTNTMNVKVTWKKAKNAKKYNVKVGSKTYKNKKGTSLTVKNLAAGTYKVKVQGVNGKKKGAWSKAKTVKVAAYPAMVEIDGVAAVTGTLTAVVYDKDGNVLTDGIAYQWYRSGDASGGDNPIAGATEATYNVVAADKGKTLYVTATAGATTAKSAETATIADKTDFFIAVATNHTAPVVGETVRIGYKIDSTFVDYLDNYDYDAYQWYADGVAINGAKHATYTVTTAELGKVLSVDLITNVGDGTQTVVTVTATEKVVENKAPTAGRIVGMTQPAEYTEKGALAAIGIPAVSDELSVEFTKPEDAADPDAEYQWYRAANNTRKGTPISGATSATYTVKAADNGCYLNLDVKTSDGRTLSTFGNNNAIEKIGKVCTNMSSAVVTLNDTVSPTMEEGNSVKEVKLDTVSITAGNYTPAWYIDSVTDATQLYYAKRVNAAAEYIAANEQYYLVDDPNADAPEFTEVSLVGHTLIATATGNGSTYVGTATSAPTPVVTATAILLSDGIVSDTAGKFTNATTLTANVKTGANNVKISGKPEVTYQWYSTKDASSISPENIAWDEISGQTTATYEPTDADALAGVKGYKVAIAGTALYKVGTTNNSAVLFASWDKSGDKTNVTYEITNERDADADAEKPLPGDILSVEASPAKAPVEFTWTLTESDGVTKIGDSVKGASYQVPGTAKQGNKVKLAVTTSNPDKYVVPAEDVKATVQGTLTKIEIFSTGTILVNGRIKEDHNNDPQYNETLYAKVTASDAGSTIGISEGDTAYNFNGYNKGDAVKSLQWYVGGKEVAANSNGSYTVKPADLGKPICVKAVGADNVYKGSEITSAETNPVTLVGHVTVDHLGPAVPVVVGKDYYAEVNVAGNTNSIALPENAEWIAVDTTDGHEIPGEKDGKLYKFTPDERSVGHSIAVTVLCEGLVEDAPGALVWTIDMVTE